MKKRSLVDVLVRGVLIKLGKVVDKVTGREWKPSSSLATSELIEKIKRMMDFEAEQNGNCHLVPHEIKIKVQWDKFSEAKSLEKLKNELLVAIVDHINDNLYHTYAPLSLEIEADYFVEGVVLRAGFGRFEARESEIRIPLDGETVQKISKSSDESLYLLEYAIEGDRTSVQLEVKEKEVLSIGRGKGNRIVISHPSVSNFHGSLRVKDGRLWISDLGSTNGTFVNGEKILAGEIYELSSNDRVRVGMVEIKFRVFQKQMPTERESPILLELTDSKETK